MDTLSNPEDFVTVSKKSSPPVVVIDYDYYLANDRTERFVNNLHPNTLRVLLVGTPSVSDPADLDPALTTTEPEWDVVIRNTNGAPDEEFKKHALKALLRFSNLSPAVAVDWFNQEIYKAHGVVVVLDGDTFG